MTTTAFIRKSTISLALGSAAFAGMLALQAQSASAAPTTPGGTFTLTFNGQTTAASKGGGTPEFAWSVQAGERNMAKAVTSFDSEPGEIDDAAFNADELAAGGGNSSLIRPRVQGWWPKETPPRNP